MRADRVAVMIERGRGRANRSGTPDRGDQREGLARAEEDRRWTIAALMR